VRVKRVNDLCEWMTRHVNKGEIIVRFIGFEMKYSVLVGDMWVSVHSIGVEEKTIR